MRKEISKRHRRRKKQYVRWCIMIVSIGLLCILALYACGKTRDMKTITKGDQIQAQGKLSTNGLEADYFFSDGDFYYYNNPEDGTKSKVGIDVSASQGTIDWEQVKEAGVEFAMIRLGYRGYGNGKIVTDDYFDYNFSEAANAGLDRGVYFFSQAVNEEEAKEEAEYVLKCLNGETLEYPIAYDFEYTGGYESRTLDLECEQITNNAAAFCQVIQDAGYPVMIYTGAYTYSCYEENELLADIPIWYAQYESKTPNISDFYMWQYSSSGEIAGIEENTVDLNIVLNKEE